MLYGPIRSTHSLFLSNCPKITIHFILSRTLTYTFDLLFYWPAHISLIRSIIFLYNYWWLVTSFESILGKKETRIFYVDTIINFSFFLELLWKSTLLVRYKLNKFRSPQVNQFDICAVLYGSYARFVPLDKMVYMNNGNLISGSSPMSQLSWNCFYCLMDYYCSIFNYTLGIVIIAFTTLCVSITAIVAKTIIFFWLLILGENFE